MSKVDKYTNVEEFSPDELMIAYNISDVPEIYLDLIKKWLIEKNIEDEWDYGNQIRMCHWEWKCGNEYYLIIDITGFPNNEEQGIIILNNTIIFENNNQVLTPLIKTSRKKEVTLEQTLLSRKKSFEHVRKLTKDNNPHCLHVMSIYEELKSELAEESVSEEEFEKILNQPYHHYSSDDCSGLSSEGEDFESY